MVDSNLQREQITPSEKAYAYKMKYDAIKKRQAERIVVKLTTIQEREVLMWSENFAETVQSRSTNENMRTFRNCKKISTV